MKVKGDLDQDEHNRGGKMSHRSKEGHGKKLKRWCCGKTVLDGEVWLLGDTLKVGTSRQEEMTYVN